MARPRALAVSRFTTRSNFVACFDGEICRCCSLQDLVDVVRVLAVLFVIFGLPRLLAPLVKAKTGAVYSGEVANAIPTRREQAVEARQ